MLRALLLVCLLAGPAHACRQALILALDVSSSVDAAEHTLQRQGVARALRDPAIRDLMIGPAGAEVALLIFEWGGEDTQRVLVDWQLMRSEAQLDRAIHAVQSQPRVSGTQPTAIGAALGFAASALDNGPECRRATIDISGDGKNNTGPQPDTAHPAQSQRNVTVNALVIATRDVAELTSYFRTQVIRGPGAFVETALGFEDYADALRRKLLRELEPALAQK